MSAESDEPSWGAATSRRTSGVHSFDEWSTLREVVVGVAGGYDYHHLDVTFKLFYFENVEPILRSGRFIEPYVRIPDSLVEELREDVEGLVQALRDFGAIVMRPVELDRARDVASPSWTTRATPALNVRDQTLILGETIVETATHVRSRYFENDQLKPILYGYFERGSGWISMPKPVLGRGTLDPSYFARTGRDVGALMHDFGAARLDGLGYEMVFDGAQCIRLGRDVLVNVANRNHELGYDWLVREFGDELSFHRLDGVADNHIDSVIMPLRPGLLLLRDAAYRDYLPAALQKWDVIYAPDVDDALFPDYGEHGFNLASRFIDMNVLSLDEETVVVNALCPEMCRLLDAKGFTVVPVRHRHRRLFSGGFHCFTLDCVRAGGREEYM